MDTIWYWTGWKMRTQTNKHKITFGKVFFTGVLLYLIAVLPFIIYHGGYFFYYGDYNVQQVPFYILATRAVRNGMLFWNPKVDLGSSMGGSFAFYLWGSPFFWLACLFPEKTIPYILPFLMSLKYGTALTCSFAWLRRRVKTDRAALLGALLYSFSGFSACNIVFQHFHEAIAFFPLYLLVFDDFVQKKRRIPFALMTAFMAVLNYFFFYGEVVFIIIYYFIYYAGNAGLRRRAICGAVSQACDVEEPAAESAAADGAAGRELAADSTAINASAVEEAAPRFGENLRAVLPEILSLLLYGALGLCLAAFFLIQVFDTVSGNTRLSDVLLGYDMLSYSEPVTPLAIIRSMFMVPDIVGRASMFASEQIRNSSLSAYLPGFALTGVIAYLRRTAGPRRSDRLRRLLLTCLITSFVPVLNSVFSAFNSEYYARWFFMPLLFMALATAIELEEQDYGELRAGAAVGQRGRLLEGVLCRPGGSSGAVLGRDDFHAGAGTVCRLSDLDLSAAQAGYGTGGGRNTPGEPGAGQQFPSAPPLRWSDRSHVPDHNDGRGIQREYTDRALGRHKMARPAFQCTGSAGKYGAFGRRCFRKG